MDENELTQNIEFDCFSFEFPRFLELGMKFNTREEVTALLNQEALENEESFPYVDIFSSHCQPSAEKCLWIYFKCKCDTCPAAIKINRTKSNELEFYIKSIDNQHTHKMVD